MEFPLIIAMRDDSNNKIAHALATFLKCPFINQNDIIQTLALLASTQDRLSDQLMNNLPFEAICQIASTQLSLKIKVVINCQLSNITHLEKLVQLANSNKAGLIILECERRDNSKDDFDVDQIPRLRVNKESFDIEKVASDMFSLLSEKNKDDLVVIRKTDSEGKNKIIQPINDHLHALTLSEKPRNNKFVCKSCSKLPSGPSYQCIVCDEFILHKTCAESPEEVNDCPSFLLAINPDQYDFQKTYKCNNCKKFSYNCCDCLLQTHLNLRFLPIIFYTKEHPHFLNFIIMPFRYNYQYLCCICNKLGSSVSYKCYDCNYDVHVSCILPTTNLLPTTINSKNGDFSFILTLNSPPDDDDGPTYRYCDMCTKKIDWGKWFYKNHDPYIEIHPKCMPKEITSDYNLPIQLLYQKYIRNKDRASLLGKIRSFDHLGVRMSRENFKKIVEIFDRDKDGVLNELELWNCFDVMKGGYENYFFDTDKYGVLDGKELEEWLKHPYIGQSFHH